MYMASFFFSLDTLDHVHIYSATYFATDDIFIPQIFGGPFCEFFPPSTSRQDSRRFVFRYAHISSKLWIHSCSYGVIMAVWLLRCTPKKFLSLFFCFCSAPDRCFCFLCHLCEVTQSGFLLVYKQFLTMYAIRGSIALLFSVFIVSHLNRLWN